MFILPASIAQIEMTTESVVHVARPHGLNRRNHMPAANTPGSQTNWEILSWLPLPSMVISIRSAAAIICSHIAHGHLAV